MKRIISLLLVLVLAFSMVACGNNTNNNENAPNNNEGGNNAGTEPEVVEKMTGIEAEISVQVETDWMPHYQAAVARVLENNPDAKINLIETGSFDHMDVLDSTDVTNADVADIFAFPADRIFGFAKNEFVASIDAQKIASLVGGYDDYDANLGGLFKMDDDYLGFPMNIETLIIFGNTANAEANGVDLSSTIEFTDLNPEDMLIPAFDAWFGVAVANTAGIELLGMNDDGSLYSDLTADWADLSADKQATITALYDYWSAHNAAGTDLWDADAAWGYMDGIFTSGGTASLRLDGPWGKSGMLEKTNEGADLAVLPINQVTIAGNPLAHWQSGWGLAVNARVEGDDDKMALAELMIAEIVNVDYAEDLFNATGKILPNVSPETYAASGLSDVDKEIIAAVINSFEVAPARPLFSEWGSVWDTWKNGVLSWSAVKPATVEDAYAEMQAAFKAMMGNF
jgi:arabinogalactan oligomer/maltooligosaccharide transport system substrate-binding protein